MSTKKPVGLWNLYTNCSVALPSICQLPRPGFTTTPLPTTVTSKEPLPPCEDTWQQYGQHCYKVMLIRCKLFYETIYTLVLKMSKSTKENLRGVLKTNLRNIS